MREERSFYWSMIQDITREALEKDCFCVLEAVGADDEKEGISPGLITGSRADGLIVLGAFSSVYEKSLAERAEIPFVFVDTRPTVKGFDAVMSDNYTGGRTMTDYLFSQGCRNIAFVGTLLMTPSIDERFFGYTRSLMGNGLRPKEPWIIPDRDPADGVIDPERTGLPAFLLRNLRRQGTGCRKMSEWQAMTISCRTEMRKRRASLRTPWIVRAWPQGPCI